MRLADGAVTLARGRCAGGTERATTRALVNTFGPEYRMLLIGAGQLTEYLATMALFSGFAVTVCDPREEYRGAWSVPGATRGAATCPTTWCTAFRPDRRSCVVALTHDPKLDDLALLEALKTEAFYVGAIGSRRNNEARHQRMIEHFDLTAADLQRLRGPDRHLHRQQDAAGDRGEHHGRDPGREERRGRCRATWKWRRRRTCGRCQATMPADAGLRRPEAGLSAGQQPPVDLVADVRRAFVRALGRARRGGVFAGALRTGRLVGGRAGARSGWAARSARSCLGAQRCGA